MIILHVDDDPDDRALVRRGLLREMPGAVLHQVGTSRDLDLVLAQERVDVAVIDYSLGWSDGLEVFRRIRGVHSDCGVVMFTGSLGEEDAVEVMKAGLDDYVVKDPSRLPRLAAAVTSLARQAGERRARRRAEARHAALSRSAGVGMFACRPDGRLIEANPAFRRILGIAAEADVTALNVLDLLQGDGFREAWNNAAEAAIRGEEVTFTGGRQGAALLDAHSVVEADGEVECVLTDVTALRAAVTQSDTLLREVYHRVYNNLQIVDAFLALQAQRFADAAVASAFQEVSERIQALSLIQRRLHQGDDFESLEFAGYLRDLTGTLSSLHRRPEIHVALDLEPVRVPIDTAIPLGLVVTEVVTNAYKHGFPDGRQGHIGITLRDSRDGISIAVEDNGVGARPGIYGNDVKPTGIGSRVVPQLVKQINAVLRVSTGSGTSVTVIVPVAEGGANRE